MKFPFTWTGYRLFTSITRKVARPVTEPLRVWRKGEEGLQVTAEGCKDLAGGRRLHVIVAIAYGKGVTLKVPYEKMTGEFFATFIPEHFNLTFAKAGPKGDGRHLFRMDSDPSQTSRVAKLAVEDIE